MARILKNRAGAGRGLPTALVFAAALMLLVFAARADDMYVRISRDAEGRWVQTEAAPPEGPGPSDAPVENYDNWRRANWGGHTQFFGDVRVGNHEVGDDLSLENYQGGILDSLGFSYTNMSTTDTMGDYTVAFQFYDAANMESIGRYQFRVIAIPKPPGTRTHTFFEDGVLQFLNMPLRESVYLTIQFLAVDGIAIDDVGQPHGGPPNTGSSSRYIRDFTTSQLIDLGEDPEANLGMFVKSVVPSPATLVLFAGSSCVFVARRRR